MLKSKENKVLSAIISVFREVIKFTEGRSEHQNRGTEIVNAL